MSYDKITSQEYVKEIDKTRDQFSDSDISAIKKALIKYKIDLKFPEDSRIPEHLKKTCLVGIERFRDVGSRICFYIVKVYDEWFYVQKRDGFGYYKCDQLDGLLSCLDDLKINESHIKLFNTFKSDNK